MARVKSNTEKFVDGVLKLAEDLNIQLFTEYDHLCIKTKGRSDSYSRFTDYVDLPDADNNAEEIFGVDYNSMSVDELRALIEEKNK